MEDETTNRLEIPDLPAPIRSGHIDTGSSTSPSGATISITSSSLFLNGEPWLPVMGEFHYARYPSSEWREELLKLKTGGIDIIASYTFWIHHEEVQGEWDWTERRSLRTFVELCAEAGLLFAARIGPWCHGEVRNGGLPDWLLADGKVVRSNDPSYLFHVRRLFKEIADQLAGLYWKDGGPVIAVQCENEYGGPAEHLLTLKAIAKGCGIDPVFFTRTGWPELATAMPLGAMAPMFGGYVDGFWDRMTDEMPPLYRKNFIFSRSRSDAAIATDLLGERASNLEPENEFYPYFTCEIGGGMERSYHRRIRIDPADISSCALVKIGSGNNLQGYYVYHGGTNPDGRLTTLQESQATGYWNDLPVKSYDFQAPLGSFGQVRPHYHMLRLLHLFLRDFGSQLAPMPAYIPTPAEKHPSEPLRWSVRANGTSGFIFVNNYERLTPLPAKHDVQFVVRTPAARFVVPSTPCSIAANAHFIWPFGLNLHGLRLTYATAQPVCRIYAEGEPHYFFVETSGVTPEFVFDSDVQSIETESAIVAVDYGKLRITPTVLGTSVAFQLTNSEGIKVSFTVFKSVDALAIWKGSLAGCDHVFLTPHEVVLDGDTLTLSSCLQAGLNVSVFPASTQLTLDGHSLFPCADGQFSRFAIPAAKPKSFEISWKMIRSHDGMRIVRAGSNGVAEAPDDSDFDHAAVWRILLPRDTDRERDVRLSIKYTGDAARIYLNGKLILDDLYNGNEFDLGLKRYGDDIYTGELLLKILPLDRSTSIYLPSDAIPDFNGEGYALGLLDIRVVEQRCVQLKASSRERASVADYFTSKDLIWSDYALTKRSGKAAQLPTQTRTETNLSALSQKE